MATPGSPKLKVFVARMGFYDSVVAARSQTAALKAWGMRQNLFADGHARVMDDAQAIAAALTQPGVPLRRLVGTTNGFELEPRGLPEIPDVQRTMPEAVKAEPALPTRHAAPQKQKRADRGPLDMAEAALRKVDDDRKAEEADLQRRQQLLDRDREAAQAGYVDARKQASAAVMAARKAYRGTD